MPRQVTSRTRKRRQGLEQSPLIEQAQLDILRADFPEEVQQICNLPPLHDRPHFIDDLLLKVSDIVYLGRRRLDGNHVNCISQSIRSSNAAAADLENVVKGLTELDIEQLQAVLFIAKEVFPRPFFEKEDLKGFFELLGDFRVLMLTLYAAIRLGTGISDEARRRGRPRSPYVQPALKLIEIWESVTSELMRDDSSVWVIKRIPTPKKLDTSVPVKGFNTKQPSTKFILITLRMINPKIKDAEVFTAIKNALALREKWYDFVRRKPPESFLRRIETLNSLSDD